MKTGTRTHALADPLNDGGDATPTSRERTRSRAWWLVAGVLITAFLARGPLYLCVFPPFEGWDEYQHLAYIAHLNETGTIPVCESRVSLALRPLLIPVPHSPPGAAQVPEWGLLSYAEYWSSPRPTAGMDRGASSSPRLYQSPQPPLSYVLALPIWRALGAAHPLEAISTIRTMNLLFVAAALVLFAGALTRLVPAFAPRVAVFALVCLHPLFFQNLARVANDALAVATGLAGISLLLLADGGTLLTRGLLAAWPGGRLSTHSSFPEGPASADGAFCRCTRRSPAFTGGTGASCWRPPGSARWSRCSAAHGRANAWRPFCAPTRALLQD